MDQWLVILIGALSVAALVMGIASVYTTTTAAKLPEQSEFIQLFMAGSVAGGILSWLLSSGYLHGSSIMSMVVSDVKSLAKEVGLKGGEEVVPEQQSVSQMVGGFMNSMGLNGSSLQELTVGMPSF